MLAAELPPPGLDGLTGPASYSPWLTWLVLLLPLLVLAYYAGVTWWAHRPTPRGRLPDWTTPGAGTSRASTRSRRQ